jgi:hypothetical protein
MDVTSKIQELAPYHNPKEIAKILQDEGVVISETTVKENLGLIQREPEEIKVIDRKTRDAEKEKTYSKEVQEARAAIREAISKMEGVMLSKRKRGRSYSRYVNLQRRMKQILKATI